MLHPSGRMFQMQYLVYGALCWAIADWKAAAPGLLNSKLAEVSFEVEFLGEVIKQLLTDGLLGDAKLDTWSTRPFAVDFSCFKSLVVPVAAI